MAAHDCARDVICKCTQLVDTNVVTRTFCVVVRECACVVVRECACDLHVCAQLVDTHIITHTSRHAHNYTHFVCGSP